MKNSEFSEMLESTSISFYLCKETGFIVIGKNQGSVYLSSLTGEIKYRGKIINILNIDGSTMIVSNKQKTDEITTYSAKYFGGGELENLKSCFVAKSNDYYAHGESLEDAIEDVEFKTMRDNYDSKDLIKKIMKKGVVTGNDYRLLTGACRLGIKRFKEENNITTRELPIKEVMKLIGGEYGADTFFDIFK